MHEIITTAEIDAPAAVVWRALTDFPAYPQWNPTIRWITGTLAPGKRLNLLFRPPAAMPLLIRVKVTVVRPEREFRWIGKLLATSLFAGEHYLILRPISPHRVELIHGENFVGVLAPFMYRMLSDYNRTGFLAMNQALKTYVDSQLSRAGGATLHA